MHQKHLAQVLNAIAYLAALATAQFITAPLEPATPALPHTAVYTTTLAPKNSPQVITTVIVTLIIPRDVGYPTTSSTSSSLITGTAISHFTAAQSIWSNTAELAWSVAVDNPDAREAPPKATLTATYIDYQHFSMALYGAWAEWHYNFYSTIRETVVEAVGGDYPATIVRTGYTDIKVEATIALRDGPTSTDPDRESSTFVRTTTLVQVASRAASRG